MRRQARLAGYGEIRTPTFEDTSVFQRGVGATTDIVEKEMYTFLDKGGDSMTLRPEATAGIIRAYLQRGMASRPQPVKLFTLLNAFRYDKPQKGRFREFHQIDFEAIGETDPLIDAELVGLQWRLYAALGLRNLSLQVNSIGDHNSAGLHRQDWRTTSASTWTGCATSVSGGSRRTRCACSTRRSPSARRCSRAPPTAPTTCAPSAGAFRSLARLRRRRRHSVHDQSAPGARPGLLHALRLGGVAARRGCPDHPRRRRPLRRPGRAARRAAHARRRLRHGRRAHHPQTQGPTGRAAAAAPACARFWSTERAGQAAAFRLAEALRRAASRPICRSAIASWASSCAADRAGARYAVILGEDELANGTVTVKDLRNGGDQRRVPR